MCVYINEKVYLFLFNTNTNKFSHTHTQQLKLYTLYNCAKYEISFQMKTNYEEINVGRVDIRTDAAKKMMLPIWIKMEQMHLMIGEEFGLCCNTPILYVCVHCVHCIHA